MKQSENQNPPPRDIAEVRRIIERYPPKFRRWCDGPWQGGCACMGCVLWPPPCDYPGRDTEGRAFRKPEDRLTREEVKLYEDWLREQEKTRSHP